MSASRPAGNSLRRAGWADRLSGLLFLLCGLGYALPGAYLWAIGGTVYYLAAGIALAACGVLLFRADRRAVALYAVTLAGTVVWALAEAGLDGWALLPRLDIMLPLGLPILISVLKGRRRTDLSEASPPESSRGSIAVPALLILAVVGFGAGSYGHLSAQDGGDMADAGAGEDSAKFAIPDDEWRHIGRTTGAERYSPLDQITPANVGGLQVAWKVRLGMLPDGVMGALEGTPLMIGDTVYACNMKNDVLAIDAERGAIRWRYDPGLDLSLLNMGICRGLTYFETGEREGPCARRIIDTVYDGRLVALDAKTGELCRDFGTDGQVNLLDGLGPFDKGYYYMTSPATLVRDRLIVGGAVLDGQKTGQPSGVIRAYDARTGAFAWAWDVGRPGERGMPPEGQAFTRGTPNAWPPLSGDDALNLVFVPLGNPTPDYVSSHRTPVMLKYGSSLVALDAATGEEKWHFQTTHRDVWDYDNPSPPSILEFPVGEGTVPALVLPTKRGEFFVLDRRSGKPLVETVEKPVPQGAAPGETLSPTQPFPVGMPSFGGGRLTEARMWGLTPFDHMWCRIRFRQSRYDGAYTPIGLDRPTVVFPGYLGGAEWSGVSIDPGRNLLVVNVNHFPMYNQLVRSDAVDFEPMVVGKQHYDASRTPQKGTPYSAIVTPFVSPLNVPCLQPPYSEIGVIDLASRKTVWRKPLGTARDSGPMGKSIGLKLPMGVPAVGGTVATASGLVFIAATQERSIRAFDIRNGHKLWESRLPAGGHANPMTYRSPASGRQFVLISASGHPLMADGSGDYLIAYALPK